MALYDKKRMFWIKLTETFMTGDICKFLLRQKGGSDYIVIYQMLCLKTVNKDGCLADFLGEIIIPFNEETIQQELQFFSIDTIRVALSLYKKLGLVYEQGDGILRIADFNNLVGSQTVSAAKKQEQLKNRGGKIGGTKVEKIPPEIEIDIEVSHESHACAHEEKAEQKGCRFGKKEFLEKYPNLKDDLPTGLEDPEADWQGLSDAFKQSEWLQSVDSLVWVLRNSGKILSGKYKTFKSSDSKSSHFENERNYSKDELNSLLTKIDDVEF